MAIINWKQELSLWGQKNLANSLSLGIRSPGFSSQFIFTCFVASDKLQTFLGCKTVAIILHLLHLVFVSEAHMMSQWASAGFYSSKGLLGAWLILLH